MCYALRPSYIRLSRITHLVAVILGQLGFLDRDFAAVVWERRQASYRSWWGWFLKLALHVHSLFGLGPEKSLSYCCHFGSAGVLHCSALDVNITRINTKYVPDQPPTLGLTLSGVVLRLCIADVLPARQACDVNFYYLWYFLNPLLHLLSSTYYKLTIRRRLRLLFLFR